MQEEFPSLSYFTNLFQKKNVLTDKEHILNSVQITFKGGLQKTKGTKVSEVKRKRLSNEIFYETNLFNCDCSEKYALIFSNNLT